MSTSAAGMKAKLSPSVGKRDHIIGPEEAPVTLVEYGDYECPHCGAAQPILKAVQELMGQRLRFVFRHFPLMQIHQNAEPAAEAAESAGEQGSFWDMHDLLFENQQQLEPRLFVALAEELDLDTVTFARKLRQHVHRERIREDFDSGVRSGVNGTPTFFINGFRHDDSWELGPLLHALKRASEKM